MSDLNNMEYVDMAITWTHDQIIIEGTSYSTVLVQDLLVTAFEGGCNYWLDSVMTVYPPGQNYADYKKGGKYYQVDGATEGCYNVWRFEGGKVHLFLQPECAEDHDQKRFDFTFENAVKGLELMKEKHPRHWHDAMNDNSDAITADVWLQLCLFGEVVYG